MRYLPIWVLLTPLCLQAAGIDTPPVPVDTSPVKHDFIVQPTQEETPTAYTPTIAQTDIGQTGGNIALVEKLITLAVIHKNPQQLEKLLNTYHSYPSADPILTDYAQSALLYMQGRLAESIDIQQTLSDQHPDLPHVRMNLATIQFEDKRYRDAAQQLQILKQSKNEQIRQFANTMLQQIDKITEWKPNGYLEYDRNRNVNNASIQDYIEINGKRLPKSQGSMPKHAEGFRYGLSASLLYPLQSNHALTVLSGINGRYYWDNHEYDQQNIHFSGGYLYQNKDWSLKTAPSFTQSWMDSSRYNHSVGMSQNISYRLAQKWRIQFSASLRKTRYNDQEYRDFDNRTLSLSPTLIYWNSNYNIYGGVSYARGKAQKASLSSDTVRLYAGFGKSWRNGWNLSADASLSHELYKQTPDLGITPYPFRRNDKTVNLDISVWQSKWQYRGFVPRLNFSDYRIISNMPAFYSRKTRKVYFSLEKMF